MFRVKFACGATYDGIADDPRDAASSVRKDGACRYAVADTDSDVQRPTLPTGDGALCMFACPAKARASGRKKIQCWPEDEARAPTRWRYVVTCYGRVESYEVAQ